MPAMLKTIKIVHRLTIWVDSLVEPLATITIREKTLTCGTPRLLKSQGRNLISPDFKGEHQ